MPIEDRRARERDERRRLIISTARRLAEAEGWDAVTTRRLSAEIEYSQPVLYSHFANMDQLAQAVAVDGFGELAEALHTARTGAATTTEALRQLAHAYVDFARQNPALYDAMFTRSTTLHFAADDTPPELEAGFTELRIVAAALAEHQDADTLAEVLWSALHGLVTLTRNRRLRPSHEADRVDLLIAQLASQRETLR
ncbi:TetR/AcrR family transcriptional regulator [Mycobacterium sp. Aquia_213]|uniref:TetR/AcrR family transcriptional regulator n=1 Tax=Mycobacterium sp. Aquia_213 TaxID=2991728 RepID=UPI00226FF0B7|nr:TetR/AcrR family transcriptional regulator [Mycobacterium sp. Aquia_213]WAC89968.1 TetR/AcrR family transcriptional regulator [Mycobacterium sp. Aquia_213]